MARYTEDQLIGRVSTVLWDAGTATFGTAQIRAELDNTLREIPEYLPNLQKATVTFAAATPILSVSGTAFADLIEVREIEYPVGYYPARRRNFEVQESTVVVDIDYLPSVGDTAYVFFSAPHTVSGTATNTLNAEEERLTVDLTAARVAINYARSKIPSDGIMGKWSDYVSWGQNKENKTIREIVSKIDRGMFIRWPRVS